MSDLHGISVVGGNFPSTKINDVDLSMSRLSKARFYNAEMRYVLFDSSDMSNGVLFNSICTNCSFEDVIFTNSVFSGSNFENCSFAGAYLIGVDFSYVSLHDCNFANAVFGDDNGTVKNLTPAQLATCQRVKGAKGLSEEFLKKVFEINPDLQNSDTPYKNPVRWKNDIECPVDSAYISKVVSGMVTIDDVLLSESAESDEKKNES